jgi:hypothetical protein
VCPFCQTGIQFAFRIVLNYGSILLPGERGNCRGDLSFIAKVGIRAGDIELLATAYEDALRALKLNDRDDPITQLVAKRIIEAAQTGLRDPDSLCATAIKDLSVP